MYFYFCEGNEKNVEFWASFIFLVDIKGCNRFLSVRYELLSAKDFQKKIQSNFFPTISTFLRQKIRIFPEKNISFSAKSCNFWGKITKYFWKNIAFFLKISGNVPPTCLKLFRWWNSHLQVFLVDILIYFSKFGPRCGLFGLKSKKIGEKFGKIASQTSDFNIYFSNYF